MPLRLMREEHILFQCFPLSSAWKNLRKLQGDYVKVMPSECLKLDGIRPFNVKCPPPHLLTTYHGWSYATWGTSEKPIRIIILSFTILKIEDLFLSWIWAPSVCDYFPFFFLSREFSPLFPKGNTMICHWHVWTDRTVFLCFEAIAL